MKAWQNFTTGAWQESIDVRDFIQQNYKAYEGDASFLEGATPRTQKVWNQANALILEDQKTQQKKVETRCFSGINRFDAGYLDQEQELIVGFQTDEPLKRIVNPYGGLRMAQSALEQAGAEMEGEIVESFHEFRKTHNDAVFDVYTPAMRRARTAGLLTGLPDAYGRGRIIGDYRRIALYGLNRLMKDKLQEKLELDDLPANEETIRLREELSEQYRALGKMIDLGKTYGLDLTRPAENAHEAIQWTYMGYLAAVQENNGAAMSFGRNTAFFDIYLQRDIDAGLLDEAAAQELIDQLIIKLRMVRHLRTPEYDELFGGDPNWVTESIGGMSEDGRTLVTKTSFRFLHSLENLGPAPEPNMTILWADALPQGFKDYCAHLSIETDALQYESDDLMRPIYGDDYGIACCVSAMRIGKDMQFFGARANLAKTLLYALNGGRDEITKDKKTGQPLVVLEGVEDFSAMDGDVLDYDSVLAAYKKTMANVARLYADTMNSIHYMHDKYAYEAGQMALHDRDVHRYMAFGIAGLSIAADSLSAIRYATVRANRNEAGLITTFDIDGEFPKFGNDDDRVDDIARELVRFFHTELTKHETYRDSEPTLSLLTITSNVVYGKKTGSTPDGRQAGEAFAPGANPMHGRDRTGALASLNSVAKLPYAGVCQDGISNTFSIVPESLGKTEETRVQNLSRILDGYFRQGAFHLNVNVLQQALLQDAYENPDKYPNLTVRVSGYAVHFNNLSDEQKLEVMQRTFHSAL